MRMRNKNHEMHKRAAHFLVLLVFLSPFYSAKPQATGASVVLQSAGRSIRIDHLFYETGQGRTLLPAQLTGGVITIATRQWMGEAMTADGHRIRLTITPQGRNFNFSLT